MTTDVSGRPQSAATEPEQPRVRRRARAASFTFPSSGWRCQAVEDLREPRGRCDACGRSRLRYVHVLHHPDWPVAARCGCVCAGELEGSLGRAREREARLLSFVRRREGWSGRKGWRPTATGGMALDENGWRADVLPAEGRWAALLQHKRFDYSWRPDMRFPAREDAQAALFEQILQLEVMRSYESLPLRQGELVLH